MTAAAPALRLGVVGVGALAQRVLRHLVLPDVADEVRVTHLADPAEGRAEAAAAGFGVPRWSRSLAGLLADPEVDAVTIASPIGLHYEQGLAAVRAGKYVHFNKTMTLTADQATHVIDEATAHGVRLVASPGEMLRPHHRRVRELIAAGAIGELCWAACGAAFGTYHEREPDRQGDGVLENADPSWYFRTPGGGPLYDMTVYSLHALTGVLGPARRVTAMSGVRIPEREFRGRPIAVDAHDNTVMLLDFGGSLFAFAYGTAAGILTEGAIVDFNGRYYGTKGSITGLLMNGEPYDYPGREIARRIPGVGDQRLLPHVTEAHWDLPEQHVFADVMQLADWVRLGVPSPATAEHARHVIEIFEAAYRSARTGQAQDLRTTLDEGPAPDRSRLGGSRP